MNSRAQLLTHANNYSYGASLVVYHAIAVVDVSLYLQLNKIYCTLNDNDDTIAAMVSPDLSGSYIHIELMSTSIDW